MSYIDDALRVLRETNYLVGRYTQPSQERQVLRELAKVAVEICVMCAGEGCRGGPDCNYRQRIASGMSDRTARWRRAVEWREIIEKREARRAQAA